MSFHCANLGMPSRQLKQEAENKLHVPNPNCRRHGLSGEEYTEEDGNPTPCANARGSMDRVPVGHSPWDCKGQLSTYVTQDKHIHNLPLN